jgi:hypothetical protein
VHFYSVGKSFLSEVFRFAIFPNHQDGIANCQEVALRLAEDILLQPFDSERLQ